MWLECVFYTVLLVNKNTTEIFILLSTSILKDLKFFKLNVETKKLFSFVTFLDKFYRSLFYRKRSKSFEPAN